MIRYGQGIFAVDAEYLRAGMAAIHLVVEKGRVALVDAGTSHSVPLVLGALGELGLARENVEFVILTHVHLDHAGGAGAMMAAFPNARLVVHPRGARHMIDPGKLIEGASAVYGADEVRKLYGEILPVPADRVVEATHQLELDLAGRKLVCLDTPGHAKHHICVVDTQTGHVFTGDTFGICLRELDWEGKQFVFPTTTPVQFDPAAMHASIDLVMSYQPDAVYLTHFGQVREVAAKAAELHRLIDAQVAVALQEAEADPGRHSRIKEGLARLLINAIRAHGTDLSDEQLRALLAVDLELNAQGLGVWLDSRAR
ncbi:MBL fold metallo-hydrolase [Propionivibrio limicola]|uniref:MBL fold metallo-hydrolase n=1 Tax=Propionivibrio limicola TaxID=167645 RepID=UPI001291E1CF|nr:MBL fold metallo-hydrolase [Propionivibrio limicola]